MYTSKYVVGMTFLTLLSGFGQASLEIFDPLTPSGDGCVDAKGFRDGVQQTVATFVGCDERCKDPQKRGNRSYTECLSVCRDIQYQDILLTWVKSCWNQVYSCEYQMTAIKFLKRTTRVTVNGGVPYYPPPPDAKEGACSCNLGYVEGNQTVGDNGMFGCSMMAIGRDTGAEAADCMCCALSQSLSAYNICPNSDLAFMGVGSIDVQEEINKFKSQALDSCAILDKNPGVCQSTYNFTSTGVAPVNIFKLPQVGKEALSNIPGVGITAYESQVITVLLDGGFTPKTITLAPWNAKAVTTAATGTGKDAKASVTGTGASAGNTGTAASNSAGSIGVPNMKWFCFAAMVSAGLW